MRRVASHTFDLMFTEPIIDAVVVQDSAAMGVDVDAVVVQPERAGMERF